MLRLRSFWSGLTLASKLQSVVVALLLGYMFVSNDLNPRNHFMGLKLWQITLPMICGTIVLGRLLLPVMMWNPWRAERILGGLGLLVFALWIFSAAQRPRILLTYLGLTAGMWLDASCWYWFHSEIRLRENLPLSPSKDKVPEYLTENDDEESDR